MKVLVTGAAGFIGFHVCKRLLARGDHVVGLDNLNDFYDVSLKEARLGQLLPVGRFQFHKLDIANRDEIARFFAEQRPEKVVHLAAQPGMRYSLLNPHAFVDSNLVGFVNILEGCRWSEVAHLVFASSSSVYGANTNLPYSVHNNVDHPVSLYAATKRANELLAHSYSHLHCLPVTGLRLFTVYGPWGRPDMAYYLFTQAIVERKPIKVFNYGKSRRVFTYIDDVVEAVVRVLDQAPKPDLLWSGDSPDPASSSAPYRLYNIGHHTSVELIRLIELLGDCLGLKADKILLPPQAGDVPATWVDVRDLMQAIGFQPRIDIEQGVARFVSWYLTYRERSK